MSQILASGKTGANKYDLKSNDPNKVLPRLDARQLAQSFQYAYEVGQGYSLSGDEGASAALDDDLSIIDVSNISTYSKDLSQLIQTFVSNNSRLLVDGASTANAITLNAPYITEEDAPDGNNYKKTVPLPFTYRDGLSFVFQATATNTGATTISIPGLAGLSGSIDAINEDGDDLVGGEITLNKFIKIVLTGTSGTKKAIVETIQVTNSSVSTKGTSYLPDPITISNGTDADHDIDFAAGNFQFYDGSGQGKMTAKTGELDAAFGTGDGMLDTGTIAIDETYHLFTVYNPTTGDSKPLASLSLTSPTMTLPNADGYAILGERIASLVTNGSANIINCFYSFRKDGSYIAQLKTPLLDVNLSNTQGTTAANHTLSVPSGLKLRVTTNVAPLDGGSNAGVYISDPDTTNMAPSDSAAPLYTVWDSDGGGGGNNICQASCFTNTSSQIRARANTTLDNFRVALLSFEDFKDE